MLQYIINYKSVAKSDKTLNMDMTGSTTCLIYNMDKTLMTDLSTATIWKH